MRYRVLILSIVATIITAIACNNSEEQFSCSLHTIEVKNIGQTSAKLTATINASDYGAIDKMGFMVALAGSQQYEIYPVSCSRIIELTLDNLEPNTDYDYRAFVYAAGQSWHFDGERFKSNCASARSN